MSQKYYIIQKKRVLDSADTWQLALEVCRYHSSLSKIPCKVLPQYWAERKYPEAVREYEEKMKAMQAQKPS